MSETEVEQTQAYPPLKVVREIPMPSSISPMAQAVLGFLAAYPMSSGSTPAVDDVAGWEASQQKSDAQMLELLFTGQDPAAFPSRQLGGVTVYDVAPDAFDADSPLRCLYLHGGGLTCGGGPLTPLMGRIGANTTGLRTISVDYRMPPHFPYPAPLDDCVAAYRGLLETTAPEHIVVSGGSAGSNLAAALVLRGRDEGLPLPRGLVLQTPEIDLTESGDSFETLMGIDAMLTQRLTPSILLYANGHDLAHPYLSPLFGDFSKGWPPTFLQAGTRDLFLSNAVRFHRALRSLGLPAVLHVFEGMPHGGFGGQTPEDAEIAAEVRRFIASLTDVVVARASD